MSRICKTCEEDKELTEFSTKGTKNGITQYQTSCKICRNLNMRREYENNSDVILDQNRKYYQKNKNKIINQYKHILAITNLRFVKDVLNIIRTIKKLLEKNTNNI